MTYKKALRVKIGDIIQTKEGYSLKVEKIIKSANSANTEKYLIFAGTNNKNAYVSYNHKHFY